MTEKLETEGQQAYKFAEDQAYLRNFEQNNSLNDFSKVDSLVFVRVERKICGDLRLRHC